MRHRANCDGRKCEPFVLCKGSCVCRDLSYLGHFARSGQTQQQPPQFLCLDWLKESRSDRSVLPLIPAEAQAAWFDANAQALLRVLAGGAHSRALKQHILQRVQRCWSGMQTDIRPRDKALHRPFVHSVPCNKDRCKSNTRHSRARQGRCVLHTEFSFSHSSRSAAHQINKLQYELASSVAVLHLHKNKWHRRARLVRHHKIFKVCSKDCERL